MLIRFNPEGLNKRAIKSGKYENGIELSVVVPGAIKVFLGTDEIVEVPQAVGLKLAAENPALVEVVEHGDHGNSDVVAVSDLTVPELKAKLQELGVDIPADAKKKDLVVLLMESE
jgi:hypothetical protein